MFGVGVGVGGADLDVGPVKSISPKGCGLWFWGLSRGLWSLMETTVKSMSAENSSSPP